MRTADEVRCANKTRHMLISPYIWVILSEQQLAANVPPPTRRWSAPNKPQRAGGNDRLKKSHEQHIMDYKQHSRAKSFKAETLIDLRYMRQEGEI